MWWFKKNKDSHDNAKTERENSKNEKEEYTNIVTTSGKRLKKIKGGYSLIGIGSDYNESGFRAV
jgi:hypothetical protein